MSFGSQTLSFIIEAGTGEYDDYGQEIVTESTELVAGCHHRPLSAAEAAETYGNVARQVWRSTCPPVAAASAAKSTGRFTEGGKTFHIIGGGQPHRDFSNPFVVTIESEYFPE